MNYRYLLFVALAAPFYVVSGNNDELQEIKQLFERNIAWEDRDSIKFRTVPYGPDQVCQFPDTYRPKFDAYFNNADEQKLDFLRALKEGMASKKIIKLDKDRLTYLDAQPEYIFFVANLYVKKQERGCSLV